jgi:hypothetical protein
MTMKAMATGTHTPPLCGSTANLATVPAVLERVPL